jgi:hypothetical protein
MSVPQEPGKAKLIIGLFMKEKDLLKPFAVELQNTFGPVDMVSPWIPFDFTDYYTSEMGAPLFRRLLAFENLIGQDQLVYVKSCTNNLEARYAMHQKRRINADPGILSHERFVLATGKNFTHRIYLKNGIFADLTLIFTGGRFQVLPWTYPDYRDPKMLNFLEKTRKKYMTALKGSGKIKT